MKTFGDLHFKPHSAASGTQARLDFPNGYGISVVKGALFFTDRDHPFEAAVMKKGKLCYTTPITDDVLGYLNHPEVTKAMLDIQALPSP